MVAKERTDTEWSTPQLGDCEKEVIFLTSVRHKFLVVDICSQMPSDSK